MVSLFTSKSRGWAFKSLLQLTSSAFEILNQAYNDNSPSTAALSF